MSVTNNTSICDSPAGWLTGMIKGTSFLGRNVTAEGRTDPGGNLHLKQVGVGGRIEEDRCVARYPPHLIFISSVLVIIPIEIPHLIRISTLFAAFCLSVFPLAVLSEAKPHQSLRKSIFQANLELTNSSLYLHKKTDAPP